VDLETYVQRAAERRARHPHSVLGYQRSLRSDDRRWARIHKNPILAAFADARRPTRLAASGPYGGDQVFCTEASDLAALCSFRAERVVGMRVASTSRVFSDPLRRPGKVKDSCWACSMPIYEHTPHLTYSGVCFHTDCYRKESLSTTDANEPDATRGVAVVKRARFTSSSVGPFERHNLLGFPARPAAPVTPIRAA